MKEATFSSRLGMLVTNVLDTFGQQKKSSVKPRAGRKPPGHKHDRLERKEFFYYQKVMDNDTLETIGHLADISSGGFKLDSQKPLPVNKDFQLRMELISEVADKPFMVFVARSRWCRVDPLDPYVFNVGYQFIHISPGDLEIFLRMMEKYGKEYDTRPVNLRRSNMW